MNRKFLMLTLLLFAVMQVNAQVPSYVPANGLIGWWPFNGNANDESGNGNNGVVSGATLTVDRFGNTNKAFNFNGNSSKIDVTAQDLGAVDFSITGWFKTNFILSSNVGYQQIISAGYNGTGKTTEIEIGQNTSINWRSRLISNIRDITPAPDNLLNSNDSVNDNSWKNFVFIKTSNKIKLYLNGVLIDSALHSVVDCMDNGNFVFGNGQFFTANRWFNGQLDDIGIWNRALTQQEITNLYTASTPPANCIGNVLPLNLVQGMVGYWPFCGNANDESGNGNNGTVNGATLTADRFGNANSAYSFDGVSNLITLPSLFNNTIDLTLSCWFYADGNQTNLSDIFIQDANAQNSSNPDNSIELRYYNNNSNFRGVIAVNNSSPSPIVVSPTPSLNNWHHAVLLKSSNSVYLYIDGNLINTSISSGTYSAFGQSLFVGNAYFPPTYNLTNGFRGYIDDIGAWNRALSPTEVQQLYQAGLNFQTVTGSCDTLIFNANITGFNPVTYQNQIKVFPNPAKDQLVIDCGSNFATINTYRIKIVNALSQTVYNSLITQQQTSIPLTSPTWAPGAYVVQFIDANGVVLQAKQIIIQ